MQIETFYNIGILPIPRINQLSKCPTIHEHELKIKLQTKQHEPLSLVNTKTSHPP
jgi:hypothetical protein